MQVIATHYPNWRELKIHESSPSGDSASEKIKRECRGYLASQYLPAIPYGTYVSGIRSENLEAQTFSNESFDLVITQDVFEHLFRPDKAISEIARTLRTGGAHIMSVPVMKRDGASTRRATFENGQVIHHREPWYHGNPVDPNGSLVTVDWGYDIAAFLQHHSGMPTSIFSILDVSQGIRDGYNAIVVSRKQAIPTI
jgi:SAM-dependent methyltransferase